MFACILLGAPIVPLKDIIISLSKHLKEKQFSSQIILTCSSAQEDNFVFDITLDSTDRGLQAFDDTCRPMVHYIFLVQVKMHFMSIWKRLRERRV